MGLLLLPFYNFKTKSIIILAFVIFLLTPAFQSYLGKHHLLFKPKYRDEFYELYNTNNILNRIKANLVMRYKWMLRLSYSLILHLIQLACFLLGIAIQRIENLKRLKVNRNVILKKIFLISLIFSVIIFGLQGLIEKNEWTFNNYYNLYYPQVLTIMIFSSSGICLLFYSDCLKRLFYYLQTMGKMTLTNYFLQNIISFALFVWLKPDWALHWYLFSGLLIYILQIFFSRWWLNRFNYGPGEWLWRCLTYRKWFSLRKNSPITIKFTPFKKV